MKFSVNNYNARFSSDEDVDYSLPIKLIGAISKELFNEQKNREKQSVSMSKSIKTILFSLAQKDGVTQLDIVNSTGLKAPTVSISLQKMENEGYVTRMPDKYDLRSVRVYITEKGKELYENAFSYIKRYESKIMKNITPSEVRTLTDILTKIKDNLR